MNRTQALTIFYDESWMNQIDWGKEIIQYGLEGAFTPGCPELNGHDVVWFENYDDDIIHTILTHKPPAKIYLNFLMWFDDGEKEVRITEDNYLDTDEQGTPLYHPEFLYKQKSGKYDPVEPDLFN